MFVLEKHDDDEENVAEDLKYKFDPFLPRLGEDTAPAFDIMKSDEVSVITWDSLCDAAQEDPVMVKLMEVMLR